MARPRGTSLQHRLRVLAGCLALVLAILVAALLDGLTEFRDDVGVRDGLITATADAADLASAVGAEEEAARVEVAGGSAGLSDARETTTLAIGHLDRQLPPGSPARQSLADLRDELRSWRLIVIEATGGRPSDAALGAIDAEAADVRASAEDVSAEVAALTEGVAREASESRRQFIVIVVGAIAVAIALLVAAMLAIRAWVLVPVRRLAAEVELVADGAFDLPITPSGSAELATLGQSVARMRDRILSELDTVRRADEALRQQAPAVDALRTLLAAGPHVPPAGVRTGAVLVPAEGELAGDWYDIVVRDDDVIVVSLGDVCGHGVEAGLLAVRAKFALLDAIRLGLDPSEAMDLVSARFGRSDTFVTAFLAELDLAHGRCRYASAGHHPALLLHADGPVEELGRTGPLIGLVDGVSTTRTVTIEPGDLIVVYTDGVVEARDADGEEYGLDRLRTLIVEHQDATPDLIVETVTASVRNHSAERVLDDLTIVVVDLDADLPDLPEVG